RRRDPGGSLHGGAVRPDRPVRRADRLSQKPRRHHHRPGGVPVERREKVTAISATSPHPNPPPRAGEGVYRRASLKNPPPLAGEGTTPRTRPRVGADSASSVPGRWSPKQFGGPLP